MDVCAEFPQKEELFDDSYRNTLLRPRFYLLEPKIQSAPVMQGSFYSRNLESHGTDVEKNVTTIGTN